MYGTISFSMKKIAIFDLDGTLLNTIKDLGKATNHALGMCGFPERRMEDYNGMVGRGIFNLFRKAMPEDAVNEENVKRMADLFIPYYEAHMCDETIPYDGIPEMLEALDSNGMLIAVASNKYQEGAEKITRHFFGGIPFLKILGQRPGMPAKPDPEIIMEIIKEDPEISLDKVVYTGDSDVDMQTGINAKIKTIGALWGFRKREELEAYHPWKLAENPEQLTSIILE